MFKCGLVKASQILTGGVGLIDSAGSSMAVSEGFKFHVRDEKMRKHYP